MRELEVKKGELNEVMKTSIQSVNDKVDSFINAGIQNLTGNVAVTKTSLQSLVAQTSKELDVIKEQSVVPLVMFSARFHSDGPHSYTANQNVVFKTVLVNEGGGYDRSTGHFTASVAGVYMFTVQYCPNTGNSGYLEIVHAGKVLQRSHHYDKDNIVCVSMQAFAKVAMGDKIWVRTPYSSNLYHYESQFFGTFDGLLVHI